MPAKTARPATRRPSPRRDIDAEVGMALEWLQARSTARDRSNLVRFGINAKNAFGVSMANIQALAKRLGRSHELAAALWQTGRYEARLLAAFVDEPARVTVAQMDRWCRDFDNWGICDTVCFKLFDQSPHAWSRIDPGLASPMNSANALRSHCWQASPATTRRPVIVRSSTGFDSSNAPPVTIATS